MWLDLLLCISALTVFFLIAAPRGAGADPPPMPSPRMREVTCGADISISDVTPRPADGRIGESVVLTSFEPLPVDLTGWTLQVGRRRARLEGRIVTFDAPLTVGSPPLRDNGGEASLIDACGITVSRMRWGAALEASDLASGP